MRERLRCGGVRKGANAYGLYKYVCRPGVLRPTYDSNHDKHRLAAGAAFSLQGLFIDIPRVGGVINW